MCDNFWGVDREYLAKKGIVRGYGSERAYLMVIKNVWVTSLLICGRFAATAESSQIIVVLSKGQSVGLTFQNDGNVVERDTIESDEL